MAHPNEKLLRRVYDAFAGQDMATLDEVFADDVAFHVPGDHPMAGDYQGKDELFGFFAKLGEKTGGTLRVDVKDVVANDDYAIGLVRVTAQRENRSLEVDAAQIHRVEAGRITEAWPVPYDVHAIEDFWA